MVKWAFAAAAGLLSVLGLAAVAFAPYVDAELFARLNPHAIAAGWAKALARRGSGLMTCATCARR